MMNVEITLSTPELFVGASVGNMRRIASMQNGNNKNKHAHKSDWATDADGACAEMAASKYYGIYWEPHVNVFHERPDLSNGYNVRSTCHASGRLIIRPNDSEDHLFILVICKAPTFRLVGAIVGKVGKQVDFFQKGDFGEGDAWWVPQDWLAELPDK